MKVKLSRIGHPGLFCTVILCLFLSNIEKVSAQSLAVKARAVCPMDYEVYSGQYPMARTADGAYATSYSSSCGGGEGGGGSPPPTPTPTPLQLNGFGQPRGDRIIVKFKPTFNINNPSSALLALNAAWGVTSMTRLFPGNFSNPGAAAQLGMDRKYVIRFANPNTNVTLAASQYAALTNEVEFAGRAMVGGDPPSAPSSPTPTPTSSGGVGSVAGGTCENLDPGVNEPLFDWQWNMNNSFDPCHDVDAPQAWAFNTGGSSVTIAILDSGLSLTHEEFSPSRVIRLAGANMTSYGAPNETDDVGGHGTEVTGILGADGNNNLGIAGMTWNTKLMPVRILDNNGSGSHDEAEAGIRFAVDNGADIINLSVGYYNLNTTEAAEFENTINYAHASGVLVVAVIGNAGQGPLLRTNVAYPGRFNNVLAVSGTDYEDSLWADSRYGPQVDIAAPSFAIMTTRNPNTYYNPNDPDEPSGEGTSLAAPLVSGLAALLKSYRSCLDHNDIRSLIQGAADDISYTFTDYSQSPPVQVVCGTGPDQCFGTGRMNAGRALEYAAQYCNDAVITEVPTLANSGPTTYTGHWGISNNNNGAVVGYASTGSALHGFAWTGADSTSPAQAFPQYSKITHINDLNQMIATNSATTASDTYVLTQQGTTWNATTVRPGYATWGYDLNNSGMLVGSVRVNPVFPYEHHAFLYNSTTAAFSDIHNTIKQAVPNATNTYAYGVANNSLVSLGVWDGILSRWYAYLYDPNNVLSLAPQLINLQMPAGAPYNWIKAIDVSSAAVGTDLHKRITIVGRADSNTQTPGYFHTVVWEWSNTANNYVMTVLPRLQNCLFSEPTDINSHGHIVGLDWCGSQGLTAVVWKKNATGQWQEYALNDLLTPEDAQSWNLIRADSINDSGQITGRGDFSGVPRAYQLTLPSL